MDSKIRKIKAREVLDSRGNPTIEVDLTTSSCFAKAIVPSGASTGIHEALELRDNDKKRYAGKGVLKAVSNVNNIIAKKLTGKDCTRQADIDNFLIELDGTENKSRLGANAILGVSMAVCKAGAICADKPLYGYIQKLSNSKNLILPAPQMNVINSGRHAGVENDIQEHMIMPVKFKNFSDALRAGVETYHALKNILKQKYGAKAILLGDEGGFAPPIENVEGRLELMLKAIEESGYKGKIKLALDCAASEFFDEKNQKYTLLNKEYDKGELIDFYGNLIKKYPIISIEDGFAQDDWQGWSDFTKKLGNKIQIVGDDLYVTNTRRIEKGIRIKASNSVLIKLNQIGTLSETLDAIKMAHSQNWTAVVSHRSGETEDGFIADFAVGTGCGQIKTGAPARSDRNSKYNQLLRIEEELGNKAKLARL
ncbi:phosphopyruvate hydratase [Candidatus Woesearchaeota archaeon]|nr:phosphopyruvate hydratase [Candidatus Woesearchaeota archaeon]